MKAKPIPISDGIAALRDQLHMAIKDAPDDGVKFEIQTIDLEMQVVATTAGSGEVNGGVEWKLLGFKIGGKASASYSYAGAHKVKLSLKPVIKNPDGTSSTVEVAADSPKDY